MAQQIEMPFPRCPHCSAELPGVALYNWQHAAGAILCVYCPDPGCHKVLHLEVVPMIQDGRAIVSPD
jgi:hypothetical protein